MGKIINIKKFKEILLDLKKKKNCCYKWLLRYRSLWTYKNI